VQWFAKGTGTMGDHMIDGETVLAQLEAEAAHRAQAASDAYLDEGVLVPHETIPHHVHEGIKATAAPAHSCAIARSRNNQLDRATNSCATPAFTRADEIIGLPRWALEQLIDLEPPAPSPTQVKAIEAASDALGWPKAANNENS
jgi:hypothetical protein